MSPYRPGPCERCAQMTRPIRRVVIDAFWPISLGFGMIFGLLFFGVAMLIDDRRPPPKPRSAYVPTEPRAAPPESSVVFRDGPFSRAPTVTVDVAGFVVRCPGQAEVYIPCADGGAE